MSDPLNAFIPHDEVLLPGAPEGPLRGLRFAAKDIYDVAGHVTGCGNPDWLATHPPATANAAAVDRLLAAGADLIGKTITDELAYSLNGQNFHYGTPVNSNAPGRIPCGSSSGSAAAVAGGAADFALGSDTGGSVRVPAAVCGIYGIRPSHGRVAIDGVMPLAASFDTVGWFARDARVLARVGAPLLGEDTAHIAGGCRANRRCLRPRGAGRPGGARAAGGPGRGADGPPTADGDRRARGLDDRLPQASGPRDLGPAWRLGRAGAAALRAGDRRPLRMGARRRRPAAGRGEPRAGRPSAGFWPGCCATTGILLLPSAPEIAPWLGLQGADAQSFRDRTLSLTCIAGLARLPQVSLPAETRVNGCPVGLSLIGPRGSDRALSGC